MKLKWFLAAAALSAAAQIAVIAAMGAEPVPIHFNYLGEADRWAGKWFYAIFAAIPLTVLSSYGIYRRAMRANENVRKNAPLEERIVAITSLFLAVMGWFLLLAVRSGQTRIDTSWFCLIFTGVGLLMMYISNYMAKIRPNHILGFRVSWTLKDETVWAKAHRLAGYTGVIGGAIIVLGSLLGATLAVWMAFAGFLAGMIVMVAPPMVYARSLYYKRHPRGGAPGAPPPDPRQGD